MKKAHLLLLLFLFSIACTDSITKTTKEADQSIIHADSSRLPTIDTTSQPPEIFMDDKLVSHKEKKVLALKPVNPYQGKSAIDSTIILIKRLGQKGRTGRVIDTLSVHASKDGASTLVFNNKNFDLSISDKDGKILGKKNMGDMTWTEKGQVDIYCEKMEQAF